jgi:hypothetical protein
MPWVDSEKGWKARAKADKVVNGARCAEVVLLHHGTDGHVGVEP